MKKSVKYWYNVKVTRALLETKPEKLDCDEKKAVEEWNEYMNRLNRKMMKINSELRKLCPILHSGYEKTMIPSAGWAEPIKTMCCRLEMLNAEYGKYGLVVNVAQSKSKFGRLCFYYDILTKPSRLFRILTSPFDFAEWLLGRLDFGLKTITDKACRQTAEWTEIPPAEYRKARKDKSGVFADSDRVLMSDQEIFDVDGKRIDLFEKQVFLKTPDRKYYKSRILMHGAETHVEAGKHKFLYWLLQASRHAKYAVLFYEPEPSQMNSLAFEVFQSKVEELVRRCEAECADFCEICGNDIKKDRCTQHGWITYVCEDCAVAGNSVYSKNDGKFYYAGKRVKSPYASKRRSGGKTAEKV